MNEMVPDDEFASWLTEEHTISHPLRLVSSSAISYIGYDVETSTLYVRLMDGHKGFAYMGVPFRTYQDFMDSPSKGKFFNKELRPHFDPFEFDVDV